MKKRLCPFCLHLLFIPFFLNLTSCSAPYFHFLEGETMGTFYHIKYQASEKDIFAKEIDSLLLTINNSLSTYIPKSTIARFNALDKGVESDPYFEEVFLAAKEVFKKSGGAFDPTVMPLVNAWGFGFKDMANIDSMLIDSLKKFVAFDQVSLKNGYVSKKIPGIMLDFSAIAKGYGVDVVAKFLESKGVKNYMVEIGGEVRLKGNNPKRKKWTVGLEVPEEHLSAQQDYKVIINATNISIATSGNYRNFYYKDGIKYAHTIDPKSGYPIFNDMLSATVLHPDCMIADAYATAFMVLGKEKSLEIVKKNPELMVYFVYKNEKGEEKAWYSEKIKDWLTYSE